MELQAEWQSTSMSNDSLQRLPLLEGLDHAKVDELIWGHRLREDQTAWMLVLEMLNVAQASLDATSEDPLPDMGKAEAPELRPRLRMRFRNLLFRLNQKAAELAEAVRVRSITPESAWATWLEHSKEYYEGPGAADYSQLKSRFDDFIQFERSLDLVRSTALNGLDGSKGIYNRFIFPMAPEALYWETGIKNSGGERRPDQTYNTFTRAGTLLHIMLARSSQADRLRVLLKNFLLRDSQARRLVRQLQIDEPDDTRGTPRTYLPYGAYRRYDLLGEDFVQILSLKAPDNDKLLWLVPLAALHVALYHAEVARESIGGETTPLPLVCEMVAPRKTVVRQLAIESLTENVDFARRAVDKYLEQTTNGEEWQQLASRADLPVPERLELALELFQKRLRPPSGLLEEHKSVGDLDKFRQEVIKFFKARHTREFSRVHLTYGREAGLVSKRATNRYRYAPTDHLVQSLVLANVVEELSFEEFMDKLYHRYGMVIGPRQGAALTEDGYDQLAKSVSGQAFRHNQSRLEARLKSMGMLRRLSDSQAYVINPLQPLEGAR